MAEGRRAVFPPNVVQPALARTSVIVKVRCRPSIALRAKGSSFEAHSQNRALTTKCLGPLLTQKYYLRSAQTSKQVYWLKRNGRLAKTVFLVGHGRKKKQNTRKYLQTTPYYTRSLYTSNANVNVSMCARKNVIVCRPQGSR